LPEPVKQGCMRHGGVAPAAMLLVKSAIGAGVLTMAAHSAEVGVLYTLVGLLIGGALTVVSIKQIGEATIATQCSSYEDICDELLHPSLAVLTGFINSTSLIGSAASYLILAGQVFQTLSGVTDEWRKAFVVFCGLCVCLPLSVARHVNFMRYLAVLSITALCFLTGKVQVGRRCLLT